ncbi:insect cuticle protein domain-containing protein [Phthorimaea operculella]|nr:insect cuticle protein domain-containing protein [Phthorimaea operculella]
MAVLLLLLSTASALDLSGIRSDATPSPSKRSYNSHTQLRQYLEETFPESTTKERHSLSLQEELQQPHSAEAVFGRDVSRIYYQAMELSRRDLSRNRSENATPSPSKRSYNSHTQLRQYLEETFPESTTKQGPVLFPNDAPPPPRPPLIVTSRPLSESIARSELNPTPEYNNSIAESTQIKPEFRLRPEYSRPKFLAKVRDYKPFLLAATPTPLHYEQYADPQRIGEYNRYGDYELKPEFRLRPEFARPKFLAKVRDYKPFLLAATPTPLHYEQYADPQRIGEYNRYGDYEIKPEFRLRPEYFRPKFLAKVRDYKPFLLAATPTPLHYEQYADPQRIGEYNRYGDYEERAEPEYNNSIAESTQIKPEFRLRPEYSRLKFLAKVRDYKPFLLVATPTLLHYEQYADPQRIGEYNRYGDYEEHSSLPPIYKAIADAAKQKVLKLKVKKPLHHYDYQDREPEYARSYQHNDVRDDIDYDHNSNYAFSYTVKDHKTGDDFSHSQHSTGSATNGEYRVRLPDGRMQIVSYTADENGYKADVRYDDEDKTAGNSIDHDYHGNRHDYHGNRHDYHGNRHDYTPNRHDHAANRYDYAPNRHDYVTNKPVYTLRPDYHENRYDYAANRDYSINRDHVTKPPPVKEDYNQYTESKEYYNNNDYSSLEYDGQDDKYAPTQKSKFAAFIPNNSNLGTIVVPSYNPANSVSSSTVRPSYEELKPLFVTKNLYNPQPTEDYLKNIEINVPSTTPSSINYEGTTEHVVLIGGSKPTNLYTNIRNLVTATPVTVTSTTHGYGTVTPQSYLESSIASLKNGQKPILSGRFIDKINKYLTFT